jgi:hypothetical protein
VQGLIGLPRKDARPSTPTKGELILDFVYGHTDGDPGRFDLHVYADGRVIWQRLGIYVEGQPSTGLIEQRLTPEGIQLVLSEVRSTGLVDQNAYWEALHGLHAGRIELLDRGNPVRLRWGECCDSSTSGEHRDLPTEAQVAALQRLDGRLENLQSWLPASAWEDPEMKAYIPSSYTVCYEGAYGVRLSGVLLSFPPKAANLLRAYGPRRNDYTNLVGSHVMWCSTITDDEARALDRALGGDSKERSEDVFGLRYVFLHLGPGPKTVGLQIGPNLPMS